MRRIVLARSAAALLLAAFALTLAAASKAQRYEEVTYLSRHTGCAFLAAEYERIKQVNAEGIPREGVWLTILRVITFPMYYMEPFVGYKYEKPTAMNIGGHAEFTGDLEDLEFAMRRKNCYRPLQQYNEDLAAGELTNFKPAPMGRRVRDDGFYFGLPFNK